MLIKVTAKISICAHCCYFTATVTIAVVSVIVTATAATRASPASSGGGVEWTRREVHQAAACELVVVKAENDT